MTGSKSLSVETSKVATQMIMDKCNSLGYKHESVICDMSNWVVDRFESHSGKDYLKKVLLSKNYEVCKRSEASGYISIFKQGQDKSELTFWIRQIN
jgi:hypothetical protein